MCTALTLPTARGALFGRTLDLDAHFGERVALTPRRFDFHFRMTDAPHGAEHHPLLGMAAVVDGYPLYADAMNDEGLCMAGLRFAGYARYASHPNEGGAGSIHLAPWELIPFALAYHKTVEEAEAALERVRLVDLPFSADMPNTPLHWMIADKTGVSLTVEATEDGLLTYRNPVGVLTNDPPFLCQLAHWRSYAHMTTKHPADGEGKGTASASPLGAGAVGLPGDYSSPSRFVRAAYLRREAGCAVDEAESPVAQFFSVLGAVAPPLGAVLTPEGKPHRTLYTSCAHTAEGRYYYKTESSCEVKASSFSDRGEAVEGERVV